MNVTTEQVNENVNAIGCSLMICFFALAVFCWVMAVELRQMHDDIRALRPSATQAEKR